MARQNCSCDLLAGTLIQVGEAQRKVLLIDAQGDDLPGKVLHQGRVLLCYALAFLYKPDWLIPDYAMDDFQHVYRGQDALAFLVHRGYLFPRGDAAGKRVTTGKREELFVKQLDLAGPIAAFAYPEAGSKRPLARLDTVAWVDPRATGLATLPPSDDRASTWLRQATRLYQIPPHDLLQLTALVESSGS